jgi:hypothetical protein
MKFNTLYLDFFPNIVLSVTASSTCEERADELTFIHNIPIGLVNPKP